MKSDPRKFIVVGITGGLASGKSSLCSMLASRGAHVVDADAVSREVTRPGSETLGKLVDAFGEDIRLILNQQSSVNYESPLFRKE